MGSISIDLSLANIWKNWYRFRQNKKSTKVLEHFSYFLEKNLYKLYIDLNNGEYQHGRYRNFIVTDSKRREIRVASIRDRVVHRLLYEYLTDIYDRTFIFDVWSCREKKGLVGAIERTQKFLNQCPQNFIWRTDIKRFFDNVDHEILMEILFFRVSDKKAKQLLRKVIKSNLVVATIREKESKCFSFSSQLLWQTDRRKGIPIGNLTSQIFANIYLNELDRFIKHTVKPKRYLRYGDDFIIISDTIQQLLNYKRDITDFLWKRLCLEINSKNNIIVKTSRGLHFLGVEIFSKGRRLNKRNWQKVKTRLNMKNVASYSGLVKKHSKSKKIKEFNWEILQKLNSEL